MEHGQVALSCRPVRPPFEQLRTSEGDDAQRDVARPFEEVVDEVEQARVSVVVILEDHDDRRPGGEPFEEGPPRREQLT